MIGGMSFLALLLALLIEQARPLAQDNWVHDLMRRWSLFIRRHLDAGRSRHASVIWCISALVPALAALLIHWLLMYFIGWPVAMAWNVLILYTTLGFRQFSHFFTEIRDALENGDEATARAELANWKRVDATQLPRTELMRHVIEYSSVASHRHVFGVMAWFSILAAIGLGPAGAVLYRMAEYLPRLWKMETLASVEVSESLNGFTQDAWRLIDWIPARITALTFAVVGNFEEAIDSWRSHAQVFPDDNDGVVLAATSGAINVRLGGEALKQQAAGDEPNANRQHSASTAGRPPELAHLRSMVGLVWRSVLMWMVLLALLTLARLLG
jgi:adenosylcobinamide-phosphate synthase